MKKFKMMMVAVVFALACGSVSASEFDWSKCWCTFGGGIEQGDVLLSVGVAPFSLLGFRSGDGYTYWAVPYSEVNLEVATYVGKLPFTFGGYAGLFMDGVDYTDAHLKDWFDINLYTGAEALYHISLPPSELDVYAGARAGVVIYFGDTTGVDFSWGVVALGARYFFSKSFGVNLEIGYPNWVKAGVTFKF